MAYVRIRGGIPNPDRARTPHAAAVSMAPGFEHSATCTHRPRIEVTCMADSHDGWGNGASGPASQATDLFRPCCFIAAAATWMPFSTKYLAVAYSTSGGSL